MTRDWIEPIFFAYTRSFWAGIVPLLLTLIDIAVRMTADPATALPAATVISWAVSAVTPVSTAQVAHIMQTLAPLFGLLIAQQRAGYARPYSLNPRAK